MSLQLRCKCGWTSQVSEFYLGDRVCCPDCGAKLNVHEQSGVPYGYAPYPTWQKKSIPRPVIMPARRTVPMQASDPYAGPAFWMGVFALVFVLTGCGAIPGAILAIFAINSWTKSRSFTRMHGGIQQGYANVGLGMGAFALGIATIMLVVMFADGNLKQRAACRPPQKQTHEERNPAAPHEFSYREAGQYRYGEHDERRKAVEDHCRKWQKQQPYREPTPTPVEPKTEFQRYQHDLSRQVSEQRATESTKPVYRYGD